MQNICLSSRINTIQFYTYKEFHANWGIIMFNGTTIVAVVKDGKCALAGDGQVTMGQNTIIKATAKKIRKLYDGKVLTGFAGSLSDAITLSERFEEKLEQYSGNLKRSAVELAKDWRQDKVLKNLEAMLIAANPKTLLLLSGNGEVIEIEEGVVAIGSGGNFAIAAAKALYHNTDLTPKDIVKKSLEIAASICIYTNNNISIEEI